MKCSYVCSHLLRLFSGMIVMVRDALLFGTFTQEHLQSLSNLFEILHADLCL